MSLLVVLSNGFDRYMSPNLFKYYTIFEYIYFDTFSINKLTKFAGLDYPAWLRRLSEIFSLF